MVKLWDLTAGREVWTFTGHKGQVVSRVLFTPDGRRAAVDRVDAERGDTDIWIVDTESGQASRLTSHPASVLNLKDRGALKVGQHADVVVFDPATIQDHATYAEPHQYSTGVAHVIVNGVLALENGEPTAARPGRFVRGRAWTGWPDGGCRATAADWDWPQVG